MKRVVQILVDSRPALIGTAGTVLLDQISTFVSILVGMATLAYLVLRIIRELKSGKK
mgnify:CR=1 FL=1